MDNNQESKLSMSIGTVNYLDQHAEITATLPGFGLLFTQLKLNNNCILDLREQQEINKSGISTNKESLRIDLAVKGFDISRKTEVYAKMVNNSILAKEVHFSETALSKASDAKLETRSLIIHTKATAHIEALAPYGVTANDLTAFKSAIDLFHLAIPTTRNGKSETKQVTDQLKGLFKSNDAILKKIDLLVELVRVSQSVFYKGYHNNRKVINTAAGTLAMIATAIDAESGEGIKGVKFTMIRQGAGSEEKPIVKITAKTGKLNIKTMADSIYSTIVAKTGYKKEELTINKAAGDQVKLVVKLQKS
jgi:hypothetical protein